MALRQTEDQVKQMRNDHAAQPHMRTTSVRNKIVGKVTSRPVKEKTQSTFLSDQDIKAALGLVDESWERQEYRLQQYLQRNYNIANGIPTAMDVDDEEFERPDTATSLGKLVEKVTIESTPTAEKELEFGTITEEVGDQQGTPLEKEIEMSIAENKDAFARPRLTFNGSS